MKRNPETLTVSDNLQNTKEEDIGMGETPRWKEREFWAAMIGNGLGLALTFGFIQVGQSEALSDQLNTIVDLVMRLIGAGLATGTTVGFQISRGMAKSKK